MIGVAKPLAHKVASWSEGEQLIYDAKPIKFWGVNNCFANCAPDKEMADKRADLYARLGINSVRLHKYADGNGWGWDT